MDLHELLIRGYLASTILCSLKVPSGLAVIFFSFLKAQCQLSIYEFCIHFIFLCFVEVFLLELECKCLSGSEKFFFTGTFFPVLSV